MSISTAWTKNWRLKNKARLEAKKLAWRLKNRALVRAAALSWYHANSVRLNAKRSELRKTRSQKLEDGYIRTLLGFSMKDDIPQSLIRAKRVHLQLLRKLQGIENHGH